MARLTDFMEFDRVIRVHGDSRLTDEPGAYAPEVHYQGDGSSEDDLWVSSGWELLNGYSRQYGYAGPVMHPSEFIGGRMELDILDEPGVYVAVVVSCDDGEDAGWAVARRVESGGAADDEDEPDREPSPADEEGWDAREDFLRGGHD
jgi:hypothetical protein